MSKEFPGAWEDDDGQLRMVNPRLMTNTASSYWITHQRKIRLAERAAGGDVGAACKLLNDDKLTDQRDQRWRPSTLQGGLKWLHQHLWRDVVVQ